MTPDRRIIEDYLPIEAISDAATSEPRTKGHISTLHIWRARRPLVACRAAVFGVLVSPESFRAEGEEPESEDWRDRAAKFITSLCQYDVAPGIVREAQGYVAAAHAARGGAAQDDEAAQAARPKVLDMYAGGGAIPLEAARLGCETYALDLNPVAHMIELCTLTFPQQYGPSLADEVDQWGRRVLARTWEQVSDLYASIRRPGRGAKQPGLPNTGHAVSEDLSVVAHYWTRTVPCPNAQCRGEVPLYRQTWLRNKPKGYVALRPVPDRATKRVKYEVVEAVRAEDLGFDPAEGMKGTNTECPFCRAPVEGNYIRGYGDDVGYGEQLMCVIALNPHGSGKLYIADESLAVGEAQLQSLAEERATEIEQELGYSSLDETIPPTGNVGLMQGKSYLYGVRVFRQAFLPRQRCVLLTMAREIRRAHAEMLAEGLDDEHARAVTTYLGLWLSRLTDRFNALSRWDNTGEKAQGITSLKRLSMSWDYPEMNIFGGASGDATGNLAYMTAYIRREAGIANPVQCFRGSATELPFAAEQFDAVITDPPYYDNESYSELSDVCYVWLRFALGPLYPEHFAGRLTPKKQEVVAAAYRQGGTQEAAYRHFEEMLSRSLGEAHRVLKPQAPLVLVYAHKTTRGWATLVDAMRRAGFEVSEAWPIQTETKARVAHRGDSVLASSIFFTARKRDADGVGAYETEVRPELERIVRERVEDLWLMGVVGADLVIAAVGAGLRAFTRFGQVQYANGEPVPAEQFLIEVQALVSETLLERVFGVTSEGVQGIDGPSRAYVLWRYIHGARPVLSGEAIVFAFGQKVELDGPRGLSGQRFPLLSRTRRDQDMLYEALDYRARGADEELGLQADGGSPPPLIDVLQRVLWLTENQPGELADYLAKARPDADHLRLVAQALAGVRLQGSQGRGQVVATTAEEQQSLNTLLGSWRAMVEQGAAVVRRQPAQMDLFGDE